MSDGPVIVTVFQVMIREIGDIERDVSESIRQKTISPKAGEFLMKESIRAMVQAQLMDNARQQAEEIQSRIQKPRMVIKSN